MSFTANHILVPVDVDPMSERVLADRLVDAATSLAKAMHGRVTLLHVALPIVTPRLIVDRQTAAEAPAMQAMLDVLDARNAFSARVLNELEVRAQAGGIDARTLLVTRPGAVPQLIANVAKEEGADLVMMTTHGRRGLNRLVLGSVAERTAHLSRVPVLLIPPE